MFKIQCVTDSQSCVEPEEGVPIPLDYLPDVAMEKFKAIREIVIALAIFVIFIIGFSVLSSLVQSGSIADFTANQRVQGLLAFVMFLPLCAAMFFSGRHFKSNFYNPSVAFGATLAAARSRSGYDTTPWCHGGPSRRFATPYTGEASFFVILL